MIDWWDMNDIKPHKNLTLGRKDGVGKPLFDYEKKILQDLCQTSFIDSANSRSKTRSYPSDSIQEL